MQASYFNPLLRTLTRIDTLSGEARELRMRGLDWPEDGAETMIGVERLAHVARCALDVLARGISGDFVECGTWRGGCGILMQKILELTGANRRLFIADSFEGCPLPNAAKYPADANDPHHTFTNLRVDLDTVQENFRTYGIDPDSIQWMKGWFKDTLPGSIERIALLRLDGDMYESTMQALTALYPLVSDYGAIILDDYQNIPNCRKAIDDYRASMGISTPLTKVDWCAVYWEKQANEATRRAAV